MLRINLLPTYVSQRRWTRKLVLIFAVGFVLSLVIPLGIWVNTTHSREDLENKATEAEAEKAKTDALKSQASAQLSQIAPLQAKVDYVKAVHDYNTSIVTFWHTVAQYSDPRVPYTDAQVSGTTLTIKAYSPNIAEVGRYLQAMYQEPDFTTVSIDKLPGYPDALVDKYYLDGRLVSIGTPPTGAGGASGNTLEGAPSMPLGGGAMPGTMSAPAMGGGMGMSGGMGGGKGSYGQPLISGGSGTSGASFGETPVSIQTLVDARIPPFASADQRAAAYQQALLRVRKKSNPKGFEITVTAVLKQPMSPPPLPGQGGAAPAPGAKLPGGMGVPPSADG